MSKILFIILFFNLNTAFAYEWFQISENKIINKTITSKNESKSPSNIEFQDINLLQQILSFDEVIKKFPNVYNPKKIILIGDTGCRILEKKDKSEYQDCNDLNKWPFPLIMKNVYKEHADLLIHLGDYFYRESCGAGKPCEKMTSATGDNWKPWELDFFIPTESVLKEVPIIIVRGNHEDCKRGHLGYKKFFVDINWSKECEEFDPPQIISLGKLGIINFDSSAIDDTPKTSDDDEKIWISRLNEIDSTISKMGFEHVWLITHKPAYGLTTFMKSYAPLNLNFRKYLEKSILAKRLEYIFSGHIHTSLIEKTQGFPTQIVIGNSGTLLEPLNSEIGHETLKLLNYDSVKKINNNFGYAVISIQKNTREIEFKNASGTQIYKTKL